jgi:uncharacterized RDD family membrane protein YckC
MTSKQIQTGTVWCADDAGSVIVLCYATGVWRSRLATTPVGNVSPKMFCGECGGSYPVEDLVRFGSTFICVNCKPGYVQRMREGALPAGTTMAAVQYGGFWIRALAVFLDALIVGIVATPVFLMVGFGTGLFRRPDPENPAPIVAVLLMELVLMALVLLYQVWFITKKGGTPGKLALGLRIVTPDGRNLTTGRAVGRYFAYILSGLVLYIGYIMAAFDVEKRALHDHICNTRVIRK